MAKEKPVKKIVFVYCRIQKEIEEKVMLKSRPDCEISMKKVPYYRPIVKTSTSNFKTRLHIGRATKYDKCDQLDWA